MEKITILDDSNASIILMNALSSCGEEKFQKVLDEYNKGVNKDAGAREQTLDCELTMGGQIIPLKPFFDKLWAEVDREARKLAEEKVKALVSGNAILEALDDMRLKVESQFANATWQIETKLREMKLDYEG